MRNVCPCFGCLYLKKYRKNFWNPGGTEFGSRDPMPPLVTIGVQSGQNAMLSCYLTEPQQNYVGAFFYNTVGALIRYYTIVLKCTAGVILCM